jgi:hypothetical protein
LKKEFNLISGIEFFGAGPEEQEAILVRESGILQRTQQVCHFSIHQMP